MINRTLQNGLPIGFIALGQWVPPIWQPVPSLPADRLKRMWDDTKKQFGIFSANHSRTARGQLIIPIGRPESKPPVGGLGPGRLLDSFPDNNGLKMANLGFRIFLNHVLNFSIFFHSATIHKLYSYTKECDSQKKIHLNNFFSISIWSSHIFS